MIPEIIIISIYNYKSMENGILISHLELEIDPKKFNLKKLGQALTILGQPDKIYEIGEYYIENKPKLSYTDLSTMYYNLDKNVSTFNLIAKGISRLDINGIRQLITKNNDILSNDIVRGEVYIKLSEYYGIESITAEEYKFICKIIKRYEPNAYENNYFIQLIEDSSKINNEFTDTQTKIFIKTIFSKELNFMRNIDNIRWKYAHFRTINNKDIYLNGEYNVEYRLNQYHLLQKALNVDYNSINMHDILNSKDIIYMSKLILDNETYFNKTNIDNAHRLHSYFRNRNSENNALCDKIDSDDIIVIPLIENLWNQIKDDKDVKKLAMKYKLK